MQSADGEGTLEVSAVLCPNLYLYVEQRMGTGHIAFVLLEFFPYQICPQFSTKAGKKYDKELKQKHSTIRSRF